MHFTATFIPIALPWLNPFSPGPTPAVMPLLFAWTCAIALIGVLRLVPGWSKGAGVVEAIVGAWLCAALLSAELGLLQYFGATDVFGQWVDHTEVGNAYANLRQRNQYATLMNIGLAALLWWQASAAVAGETPAASGLAWARARRLPVLLPLGAAVLLGLGNAASSSRTGLVQGLAVLVVAGWWGGWRVPALRRVLLAVALAYAGASLALPALVDLGPDTSGILSRLNDGSPACSSRLALWGNVLQLIAQKPWLGWGWGELDYAHFVTLFRGPRFCEILDNAHNLPLHLAVELGLPLALAVCAGGVWLVWCARPWAETDATRQLAWTVVLVILLHSLLEYPLWYGPFQMAFGLSLWLLWRSPQPVQPGPGIRPTAVLVYVLPALVLLGGIAYTAWDYHRVSQIYLPPTQRSAAYRENTLAKLQASWLFRDQARFAELTITPLTPENAAHQRELALELLHFSPEPRVAELLIESAVLLGRPDEAEYYLIRYRAAYPDSHALWAGKNNPP